MDCDDHGDDDDGDDDGDDDEEEEVDDDDDDDEDDGIGDEGSIGLHRASHKAQRGSPRALSWKKKCWEHFLSIFILVFF